MTTTMAVVPAALREPSAWPVRAGEVAGKEGARGSSQPACVGLSPRDHVLHQGNAPNGR